MSEEIKEAYIRMLSHTIHYDCCYDADADNDFENISDYIANLQQKVEQLENIKKEAREYINNNSHYYSTDTHEKGFVIDTENEEMFCNDLLNILNKGGKSNV